MNPADDPGAPPGTTLRSLFDRALALPAGQRAAFLDRHCADPDLRARLDRLLAAEAALDAGATLSARPALRLAEDIGESPPPPAWSPGQRIGAFELCGVLGQGGSSTVFRAVRDLHGGHQQVALKLLHRGLYSPEAERLFRREHRALASLSHPNIAHLIDGGVTADGHPYLAMEYVDGVPVTDYAARHQLGVRERLRLVSVVCRAVAAAHRALIVHRDLKPSNILVDDQGRVKLLDFGIAKLLDEGQAAEDATRTGYAPLTPGYAAPEQYTGAAISTATDVYALGVVMHELLLGERPAGQPVPRPSARVAELATDLWALPAPRPALRTALRGDLDTILMKALAEEPARRYASGADLADDIDRHLDNQPVRAHPPSRWYRTRKFVQRHRGGVALTTALMLAVLASLAMATWQSRIARMEATRANAAAAQAQASAEALQAQFTYLDSLLDVLAPGSEPAGDLDRPKLVADAARRAVGDLAGRPLVLASIELSLARVAGRAGDYAQALALAESAHDRRRQALGDDDVDTARALASSGEFLNLGNPPRHDQALQRQLAATAVLRRRAAGSAPLVEALHALSSTYSYLDRPHEALAVLAEADALCTAAQTGQPVCEDVWKNQGIIHTNLGQDTRAIPPLERAWAARRQRLGEDHALTLDLASNLAWAYAQGSDFERGLALAERAHAARQRIDPRPTQSTLLALRRLSRMSAYAGRSSRAAELNAEFLGQARLLYGDDHRDTVLAMMDAASSAYTDARFEESARLYASAAAAYRGLPDGAGLQPLLADLFHAYALRESGRAAAALSIQEGVMAQLQERFPDRAERIAAAWSGMAATLSALGRNREALRAHDRGIGIYRTLADTAAPALAMARAERAHALLGLGDSVQAEAELRDSLAEIAAARGLPPRPYWERFGLLVEAACRNRAADCAALRDEARQALQRPLPGIVTLRLRQALAASED
ncbi:MAG: serine/threonine-protein kinase [Pseudoxanthomonas sp.]|nr:serine/threonine-protein kinase [Pseudoxanthomonas sp.]